MKRWEERWQWVLDAYRHDYPDLPEDEWTPLARVVFRFLEGDSREASAVRYGLDPNVYDQLLERSARPFLARLRGQPAVVLADDAEARAAVGLREQTPAELLALVEHREAVKALLVQAEAEAEKSPQRARENWLRRVGIVLILAATAYFYWQEQQPKPVRYEARPAAGP